MSPWVYIISRKSREKGKKNTMIYCLYFSERDIVVAGQTIPARTEIRPVMAEILKGDYWGDGRVFRPERFLDDEGKVRKDDHLIPFSIGKRQCLGEKLAKTELYLFFTGLVQQFTFLPEKDVTVE